jgi:hypothetical protein
MTEEEVDVRLYKQFVKSVVEKRSTGEIDWEGMHLGLMSNKKNKDAFNALRPDQCEKFFEASYWLSQTVEKRFGGEQNFFGKEKGKWNIRAWFPGLIHMAMVKPTENDTDCWESELNTNEKGRPVIA